jgi:hypothetical protein
MSILTLAEWESVTINAGYGTRGFIIDLSTGLKWTDAEFGGWLGKSCHNLFDFLSSNRCMQRINQLIGDFL